jgi:uncharacterized protein (TIGR02266 family)
MRIKLKYPDIDTFIQKYAVNISRGGIFIATKQPKPIGTYLRFEFLLSDDGATSIIRGEGQVQWTKDYDAATPGKPHGMGVKFMRLDADSQAVIDRALRWRADHGTSPNVALPSQSMPVSSAHSINTRDDYDRTSESPPLDAQINDPERTARVNVPELLARAGSAEPPDETARVDLPEMLARTASDERQDTLGVPQAVTGAEPTDRVSVAQLPQMLARADENEETMIGQRESPLYVRPPAVPPPVPSSSAPPSSPNDGLRNGELASREGSLVGQLPTRASTAAAQASSQARRENGQHSYEAPPQLMEPAAVARAGGSTAPLPDRRGETRPIAIEHREEHGRSPQDATREIALTATATWPKRRDELDQLASEWGLTEERLQRTLKRTVRPRIAEATAELERLLLKPPKPPTPTIAEALEQLGPLLARRRGRNGTPPRG